MIALVEIPIKIYDVQNLSPYKILKSINSNQIDYFCWGFRIVILGQIYDVICELIVLLHGKPF